MVINEEIKETTTVKHKRQNDGENEFTTTNGKMKAIGVTINIGITTILTNRAGGKCNNPFIIYSLTIFTPI